MVATSTRKTLEQKAAKDAKGVFVSSFLRALRALLFDFPLVFGSLSPGRGLLR
jgi:hypothetical protein